MLEMALNLFAPMMHRNLGRNVESHRIERRILYRTCILYRLISFF